MWVFFSQSVYTTATFTRVVVCVSIKLPIREKLERLLVFKIRRSWTRWDVGVAIEWQKWCAPHCLFASMKSQQQWSDGNDLQKSNGRILQFSPYMSHAQTWEIVIVTVLDYYCLTISYGHVTVQYGTLHDTRLHRPNTRPSNNLVWGNSELLHHNYILDRASRNIIAMIGSAWQHYVFVCSVRKNNKQENRLIFKNAWSCSMNED